MGNFNGCVVLLTGGAGFIGHHLLKKILEKEPKRVIIVDDLSTGDLNNIASVLELETVEFINVKAEELKSEVLPERIDFIFHLAAIVSVPLSIENPFLCHKVNEHSFLNVLEIAKIKNTKKVIFASSSAVYGETENVPIKEDVELHPMSPYAFSKYINELHAQSYASLKKISFLGFRFFNVFGSGQKANSPYSGVISLFLDKIRNNQPITIFGDGNQVRDFVHVTDVVSILVESALSQKTNQIYNIGTGIGTTINGLLVTLQDLLSSQERPTYAAERAGDIKKSIASTQKLIEELEYKPSISLREGLKQLISEDSF